MLNKEVIRIARGLFVTGMILLLILPAKGQLISVQSIAGSDSLMIGEQINYTLRVDAASDLEFILPTVGDTLSSSLEVISRLGSDTIFSEGKIVVEQHYVITGFESGSQILPSQEYGRRHLMFYLYHLPNPTSG